jgi:hypothetical protein
MAALLGACTTMGEAKYERAFQALETEPLGDYCGRSLCWVGRDAHQCPEPVMGECWVGSVERCSRYVAEVAEVTRAKQACIDQLQASGRRPGRARAKEALSACMDSAGWHREQAMEWCLTGDR